MGGNALKHLAVQRISAKEYYPLVDSVCELFFQMFQQQVSPIKSYATKPDFGDVDLLIVTQELPLNWRELLAAHFNSRGYVLNGDVTSMEIHNVQFDFINCQAVNKDWTEIYFAYNDLGNLMGRIANQMGFKYGHKGLIYLLRDERKDHVLSAIELHQTAQEVFDFLGYDYAKWQQGFYSLEDIFEFVVSSKWFNSEIFLLHNRNYTSRIRDAKRKSYTAFLKWCEDNHHRINQFNWKNQVIDQASFHLERACKKWPELAKQINLEKTKEAENQALKLIWNGQNVSDWTGYTERALGNLMKQTQQHPDFIEAAKSIHSLKELVLKVAQNNQSSIQ